MAVKAKAQITVFDMTDAYSVILTSEAFTFAGNTSGAPSGLSCSTQAVAYCGGMQCKKVTIGTVSCPTGISAAITNNSTASPTITFKTTATVTTACEATIPVTVDDVTINKKFSFSVAKTGATGKGIKSTTITYQLSSSSTTAPTGTWTAAIPAADASKPYLWTKTVLTYTDGTTSTGYSVGSSIDGIEIGGRNLINNSNFSLGDNGWVGDGVDFLLATDTQYEAAAIIIGVSGNRRIYQNLKNVWKENTNYAYSFDAKIDSTVVKLKEEEKNIIKTGTMSCTISSDTAITVSAENPPSYCFAWIDITNLLISGVTYELRYESNQANKNGGVLMDEASDAQFNSRSIINATKIVAVSGKYYRIKFYVNSTGSSVSGKCTNVYSDIFVMPVDFEKVTLIPSRSLVNNGQVHAIASDWKHFKGTILCTETVSSGTLSLSLGCQGVPVLVTNIKLEKGNKATDWTPAPEDYTSDLNDKLTQFREETASNIDQTAEAIKSTVYDNVYLKDDVDSLVSSVGTEITQTKDSWQVTFNDFQKTLNSITDGTDAEFAEIKKYIRFEDGNILLGNNTSPLILKLKNDRIQFLQNGYEVAYISDQRMYNTVCEIISQLKIADSAWTVETNASGDTIVSLIGI